jgi:hypothetical protein
MPIDHCLLCRRDIRNYHHLNGRVELDHRRWVFFDEVDFVPGNDSLHRCTKREHRRDDEWNELVASSSAIGHRLNSERDLSRPIKLRRSRSGEHAHVDSRLHERQLGNSFLNSIFGAAFSDFVLTFDGLRGSWDGGFWRRRKCDHLVDDESI